MVPYKENLSQDITVIDDLTGLINRELPHKLQRLLWIITHLSEEEGYQVYLVGGIIRDLFLGVASPRDLDLVVIPEAIPFANRLNHLLQGKLITYDPFGTATIYFRDGSRLDLVTARKEFYPVPGKLPNVEMAGLKNDLFRRDFSINTLACSLKRGNFGEVIDFFGGRQDLQDGIIRILYQLSFVDDPLRLLRAIRFEQRFGFHIERDTERHLKHAVKKRNLGKVSRDRLNEEIRLIFRESKPAAVLERLYHLGILTQVFPRLCPDARIWERVSLVKEVVEGNREGRWIDSPDEEILFLAALFYGSSQEEVYSAGRRMHLSRERLKKLEVCCRQVPAVIEELRKSQPVASRVYRVLEALPEEALLTLMAVAGDSRIKDNVYWYRAELRFKRPNLTGEDLKAIGFTPGPLMGRVLKELQNAVLDGTVNGETEERKFAQDYLSKQDKEEGCKEKGDN